MASKRRIRRSQCSGKIRHTSHDHALIHLHSIIKSGKKRGGFLHVYKCSFCHGWHVGHACKGEW